MAEEDRPEKRPGPFAQDPSRTPPTKEQREKDYQPEKRDTGEAIKKQQDQKKAFKDLRKVSRGGLPGFWNARALAAFASYAERTKHHASADRT